MRRSLSVLVAALVLAANALAYSITETSNDRHVKALAERDAAAGDERARAWLAANSGDEAHEVMEKSAEWISGHARRGRPEAQLKLGTMLDAADRGNPARALEWYRKAAAQGYAPAILQLAKLHAEGRGLEKDAARAIALATQAAEKGDVDAQHWLAVKYHEGRIVAKDPLKMAYWYEKAAEQGDRLAIVALAALYRGGQGVPADPAKVKYWMDRLSSAGAPAPSQSAESRLTPEMILAAARKGDRDAQAMAGFNFLRGRSGFEKDDQQALGWLTKAAEAGDALAQADLGFMYEVGRGVAKDEARAAHWYRRSAEQGHAGGQAAWGNMLRYGLGGVPLDEAEAARLFGLSADQGHATGLSRLAQMYEAGKGGLARDRAKAVELYRQAARKGYPFAIERLKKLGEAP